MTFGEGDVCGEPLRSDGTTRNWLREKEEDRVRVEVKAGFVSETCFLSHSPRSLTYSNLEVALYKTTHEARRLETALVLSPVDPRASNETPGSGRLRWPDREPRIYGNRVEKTPDESVDTQCTAERR